MKSKRLPLTFVLALGLTWIVLAGLAQSPPYAHADASTVNKTDASDQDRGFYTSNGTPLLVDVTISHNAVQSNTPPVAEEDFYTTGIDQTLNQGAPGVLGNDSDADGDNITATLDSGPGSGTLDLSTDGAFIYTPTASFSGTVNFFYHANDGQDDSNVVTVTIVVGNACSWSSSASSTDWSTPGNWNNCGGGAPSENDTVTIGSATNDPVLDTDVTVAALTLNNDANLTISGTHILTVICDTTVTGDITIGGTGTLSANDLKLAAGPNDTVTISGTVMVQDDLIINSVDSINGNSIQVAGDVTNAPDVKGTAFISLVGSTDQTITGTGKLTNLDISKSGGSVLLPVDLELNSQSELTTVGVLRGDGYIRNVGGKLIVSGDSQDSYSIDFAGTIDDLQVNISHAHGVLNLYQDVIVSNTLTINSGDYIVGVGGERLIKVSGDVTTNNDSYSQTNSFISLVGSTDQTISGTGKLINLEITKTGGSVLLPVDIELYSQSDDAAIGVLRGDGHIRNVGGKLIVSSGSQDNYTIDFAGTIDDLQLDISNGQGALNLQQDVVVSNTLMISSGYSIVGVGGERRIKVSGDVTTNDDTYYQTDSLVSLVGSTDQTISGTGKLPNLEIAKTGGSVLLPDGMSVSDGTLTGAGQISGTVRVVGDYVFDFAGTLEYLETLTGTTTLNQDLTINKDLLIEQGRNNNNYRLNVYGNVYNNNNYGPGSAIISLAGSTDQIITGTGQIANLEIAKTGGVVLLPVGMDLVSGTLTGAGQISGTVRVVGDYVFDFAGTLENLETLTGTTTLNQDLTINKDLLIEQGRNNNNYRLNVYGNVYNNNNYGPGSAIISLAGSTDQIITGTGQIANLEIAKTGGVVQLPVGMDLEGGTLTGDGQISGTVRVVGDYVFDFAGTLEYLETLTGTTTLNQDLTINKDLLIEQGRNNNNYRLNVYGNVYNNNNYGPGSAIISLAGSTNQIITGTGILLTVEISKTGGTALLGVDMTISLLTLKAGDFSPNNHTITGQVTVSGGALVGEGTVVGDATVSSGGTLNAGSPLGLIRVNGNLMLNAGANLFVDIQGSAPGTQHDQIIVTGTVTIDGAVLTGSTSAELTVPITIITNDAADAIVGSGFANAPNEGDVVAINGESYQVSYIGGNGNDLTLTQGAQNYIYLPLVLRNRGS